VLLKRVERVGVPMFSSSSSSSSDVEEEDNGRQLVDDLKSDLKSAEKTVRRLHRDNESLREDLKDLEKDYTLLENSLDEAKDELADKTREIDSLRWDLTDSQLETITATSMLKQAEKRARDAEHEAENLEKEAEDNRVALEKSRTQVEMLQAKLRRKRDSKGDLLDALDEASSRLENLERRLKDHQKVNEEFAKRVVQQERHLKRGKLLQDICVAPANAGEVGLTECYVEQFGVSVVFEPTEACSKPLPPLRRRVVSSISDAWITRTLLTMHKTDSSMMLQFCAQPGMWRDCLIAGPSSDGSPACLSIVPRHKMQGEQESYAQDVSVSLVRFADFVNEEEFFLLLKKSQGFIAPAPRPVGHI